jgi:hypothetical protein
VGEAVGWVAIGLTNSKQLALWALERFFRL